MMQCVKLWLVAACVLGANSFALAHPGHDHGGDAAKPANLRTWTEASGVFQLQASFVLRLTPTDTPPARRETTG